MLKICIQEGHINNRPGMAAGAPGEKELTKRIGDRLASVLRDRGFEVTVTDSNADLDPNITKKDWSLLVALHGDADYANDGGSGFATFPEPSTDGATAESQRIAKVINETYFPDVKIVFKDRSNANTKFYYLWKFLTASTPCVLVEMGQVQDPHDKVLLANTDLIANALGKSICKAFNVPFDPITPPTPIPPVDPCAEVKKELAAIKVQLATSQAKVQALTFQITRYEEEGFAKIKAIIDNLQ